MSPRFLCADAKFDNEDDDRTLAYSYSFCSYNTSTFRKAAFSRSCVHQHHLLQGSAESTSTLDVRIVRECFHRLIMNYLIIGTLFNGADSRGRSGGRAWGTAEACLSSSPCHACVCVTVCEMNVCRTAELRVNVWCTALA